ncbi:MAG TPA: S8 family serine peptidase, partial [Puia sp.]|nr:S8 family serine peptidase [Puia sp.]
LPTGLRLDADARYPGKGITICFIDSGFYPHPDLVATGSRIRAIVDITSPDAPHAAGSSAWHGTMTSVVCAGDGFLSKGLYKGIASGAELVLLKVQDEQGRITTENIVKALEWISLHHDQYGIRIVNMSLGGDEEGSYKDSRVDQLAEALIAEGIVVVAAVGNDEYGAVRPPANSPNTIAVGGIDDSNESGGQAISMYHSSYGRTIDEFMKPELLAHAIWIAAPILPGTAEQEEAAALYGLARTTFTGQDPVILSGNGVPYTRESVKERIRTAKYISADYMHVDGTSFAAPIVSAVIAQLLEVNPQLSPYDIRHILFSTARRMAGTKAERQGFGIVQPRKAILKVLKKEVFPVAPVSPFIDRPKKRIQFFLRHDCAEQISLAGSFNGWTKDVLLLEPGRNSLWKIEIPMLPEGRYTYKFFADEKDWLEDLDNPFREPDSFGGFNSLLIVE